MIEVGYEAYVGYEDVFDSYEETLKFITWPIAHGYWIDDELIGSIYGYSDGDIFHIYSVEMRKSFQNQGLGSMLLNFALFYAKMNNFKQVRSYALTDGGKKLLSRYGFVKIGEKFIGPHLQDVMVLNK